MSKTKVGKSWTKAEWLKVATMAYGLISEHGQLHRDALRAAQVAVLPRKRWRPLAKLAHTTAPSNLTWQKYLKLASDMTPDQREQVLLASLPSDAVADEAPAPTPAPAEELSKGEGITFNMVRWTTREWAIIARAAEWEHHQDPDAKLWENVDDAQKWALPADRQRSRNVIAQSYHKRKDDGKRLLAVLLDDGKNNRWQIDGIAFTPPGTEPEKSEELAPPPVVVEELSTAEPFTTGGALPSSIAEAAKAFGDTMMQALGALLHTHQQAILNEVNARITLTAAETGNHIAAMIEAAMRRTVHSMVEQELGGPINPPAPPANEPANGSVILGEATPRKRVKIDVVGVPHGVMMHEIQRSIDESIADVRFIHPDASYAPHGGRHIIMIQQKISHSLSNKIKAAKIKPIFVPRATAGHVTHAIEELQRSALQ